MIISVQQAQSVISCSGLKQKASFHDHRCKIQNGNAESVSELASSVYRNNDKDWPFLAYEA